MFRSLIQQYQWLDLSADRAAVAARQLQYQQKTVIYSLKLDDSQPCAGNTSLEDILLLVSPRV